MIPLTIPDDFNLDVVLFYCLSGLSLVLAKMNTPPVKRMVVKSTAHPTCCAMSFHPPPKVRMLRKAFSTWCQGKYRIPGTVDPSPHPGLLEAVGKSPHQEAGGYGDDGSQGSSLVVVPDKGSDDHSQRN